MVNLNKTVSAPATVPGNIFLDLLQAGVINDTLYRDNEQYQHWIAYDTWTYSRQFQLPSQFFAPSNAIEIIFEGIDTVATVSLNGMDLFQSANQHLRYSYDITSFVVPSSFNTLTVTFYSPVLFGQNYLQQIPYPLPNDDANLGLLYRNGIRKGQSDFGWDWGVATGGCGLYRSVSIVSYNAVRISDVTIDTYFTTPLPKLSPFASYSSDIVLPMSSPSPVAVDVRVYLQKAAGHPVNTAVEMSINGTDCAVIVQVEAMDLNAAELAVDFHCELKSALLWWPQTYSSQHTLYTVSVSVAQSSDSRQKRFGVRSVELVRDPLPDGTTGATFYFRINGVPIYMKGSNLIPLDAFPTRATALDMHKKILDSAQAANQNVVRVWGGGLYQPDEFYDHADEQGLMVWQEFAFACSIYPRDNFFIATVTEEVRHQTRRLSSHPSIVVFGANNEDESALDWFSETTANRDLYLTDYVKLYIDTVRGTFLRTANLSNIPFLTSSPSNGPIVEDFHSDYYVQRWGDVSDVRYGDVHFYDYDDDCSSPFIYPRAKFMSEFGFQSEPSFFTLENVTIEQDWSWDSDIMNYRQRLDNGNNALKDMMTKFFNFPNLTSSDDAFKSFIYLTQVVQSICYSTALSHWRRIKQESSAYTQGILYWQLNDVWQAPTWSSLEYGGRWKLLHYQVKKVFSPILVSAYIDQNGDTFTVYFTTDLLTLVKGQVSISVIGWDSKLHGQIPVDVSASPLSSHTIYSGSLSAIFSSMTCSSLSACFIVFSADIFDSSGQPVDTAVWPFYPVPLKNIALPTPTFAVTVISVSPSIAAAASTALVSVESSATSPWTWLETDISGVWQWNGELLLAGDVRNVTFTGDEPFTASQLLQSLSIRSIRYTYL